MCSIYSQSSPASCSGFSLASPLMHALMHPLRDPPSLPPSLPDLKPSSHFLQLTFPLKIVSRANHFFSTSPHYTSLPSFQITFLESLSLVHQNMSRVESLTKYDRPLIFTLLASTFKFNTDLKTQHAADSSFHL